MGTWQELWSISYYSLMIGDTDEMSGLDDEVDEIVNLARIKNQVKSHTNVACHAASGS